ncbi:Guanine nucleotide-binding protein subunit gamma [Tolypocladium paradoxum]|uniref:Guanine nucleotide-binding protein subunit gamma n=1 Tax=Tolypocladium paradoxum TaxID=94208 RepID=A0A2S4KTM6_9HYPO|nr:Guanine nucleotide-binding protein subunit gamma [Tolypocladium paradoxum]
MPQYTSRDVGDPSQMKKTKQSMADLKLRRLTELNNRLREDLERERIPVSTAAKSIIAYCNGTRDYMVPSAWGAVPKGEDPYAPQQSGGCCVVIWEEAWQLAVFFEWILDSARARKQQDRPRLMDKEGVGSINLRWEDELTLNTTRGGAIIYPESAHHDDQGWAGNGAGNGGGLGKGFLDLSCAVVDQPSVLWLPRLGGGR